MKQFSPGIVSLLLVCTFAVSSTGTETRESRRLRQGKITKNEAQHLVLAKFPGSKITRCELQAQDEHGLWVIDLVQPGSGGLTRVQVDGRSGKITH